MATTHKDNGLLSHCQLKGLILSLLTQNTLLEIMNEKYTNFTIAVSLKLTDAHRGGNKQETDNSNEGNENAKNLKPVTRFHHKVRRQAE